MVRKKLLVCGIIAGIAVLLYPVFLCIHSNSIGSDIYENVHAYLDEFPSQNDSYVYTAVYAECEGTEYLFLQHGEKQVLGKRLPNGKAEYYLNDRDWDGNLDGVLVMSNMEFHTKIEEITSVIRWYANGTQSIASCAKADGGSLPYWIENGEYFVQTSRQDSLREIMALQNKETNCMRWYIIDVDNSYETPSVKLFFHACDADNIAKWISASNLWGELPQEFQAIFK